MIVLYSSLPGSASRLRPLPASLWSLLAALSRSQPLPGRPSLLARSRPPPGVFRLSLAGSSCSWLLLIAPDCFWLLLAFLARRDG